MKYIKLFENRHENYQRVIPRDFFNESKLLKCMGFLALKIHECKIPNNIDIKIEENDEPFDIQLTVDGSLTIINYPVMLL